MASTALQGLVARAPGIAFKCSGIGPNAAEDQSDATGVAETVHQQTGQDACVQTSTAPLQKEGRQNTTRAIYKDPSSLVEASGSTASRALHLWWKLLEALKLWLSSLMEPPGSMVTRAHNTFGEASGSAAT
jgi:hypothetical protein